MRPAASTMTLCDRSLPSGCRITSVTAVPGGNFAPSNFPGAPSVITDGPAKLGGTGTLAGDAPPEGGGGAAGGGVEEAAGDGAEPPPPPHPINASAQNEIAA